MMPDLPELLVLRHGETEWNRDGRFQGARDSPLTSRGRKQARELGRLLARLGVSPRSHAALVSPQGRALETAQIALGPLGIAAAEDPRLVEIGMGDWTGLKRAEIAARWPGPPGEGVLTFYARCPGGEALDAVAERAHAVLAGLEGPTVIVTHGITLRVLCALALGRGLDAAEGIAVPQGSLVRITGGQIAVIGPEALPQDAGDGSPRMTGG